MTSELYLRRYAEISEERGWRRRPTPAGLLQEWRAFVDLAEGEGHGGSFDEYWDWLSVRDLLDVLFRDSVLAGEDDVRELESRVVLADERLRVVFDSNVSIGSPGDGWWRRGLARTTDPEMLAEVAGIYGLEVFSGKPSGGDH